MLYFGYSYILCMFRLQNYKNRSNAEASDLFLIKLITLL